MQAPDLMIHAVLMPTPESRQPNNDCETDSGPRVQELVLFTPATRLDMVEHVESTFESTKELTRICREAPSARQRCRGGQALAHGMVELSAFLSTKLMKVEAQPLIEHGDTVLRICG